MSGLTTTVLGRMSDPQKWHPRARTEDEVAAEFPEPKRAERLVHKFRGQKFRPHGTDSIGRIVSHPRSRKSVQFVYRHDPDTVHSMPGHEFNTRFAVLFEPRTRRPRPAADGIRQIRPTPVGLISSLKGAA